MSVIVNNNDDLIMAYSPNALALGVTSFSSFTRLSKNGPKRPPGLALELARELAAQMHMTEG